MACECDGMTHGWMEKRGIQGRDGHVLHSISCHVRSYGFLSMRYSEASIAVRVLQYRSWIHLYILSSSFPFNSILILLPLYISPLCIEAEARDGLTPSSH